ncbi:hypothetical protein PAXRUDRAFT_25633 [Paxillus rubicundulus Ve08.2h10]|uniref:Uncharacterized protein n=1 Tax=Paxillus rubicundulus Ve08.2h10 TaxID=930991 RepID=A0A0D0DY39_9AGAM|nr:hypothetical protein PAXRUDRAFT_25633 [Paxillus rubicundulus Ve08.2h10]
MYLFLENIAPTLVNLWTGQFKGLDTGTEDYKLVPHIWAENVWGFWFMYLAPILLKGQFQEDKYYYHMLKLSDLMKIMVKLELQEEEINMIENRLIEWVEEYKENPILWASVDQLDFLNGTFLWISSGWTMLPVLSIV